MYRLKRGRPSTGYAREMPGAQTRTSYHHGALRDELIRACVALIEAEGIGAVSLRRVARAAGVSPGAPYHHFADRSALLTAISKQGYQQLSEELRAARAQAADPMRALGALVETYVRYAQRQPAHFQLMFRPELCQLDKDPDASAAADQAFQVLAEVVDDCQRAGDAPAGDPAALVAMVWAIAHGIA